MTVHAVLQATASEPTASERCHRFPSRGGAERGAHFFDFLTRCKLTARIIDRQRDRLAP